MEIELDRVAENLYKFLAALCVRGGLDLLEKIIQWLHFLRFFSLFRDIVGVERSKVFFLLLLKLLGPFLLQLQLQLLIQVFLRLWHC